MRGMHIKHDKGIKKRGQGKDYKLFRGQKKQIPNVQVVKDNSLAFQSFSLAGTSCPLKNTHTRLHATFETLSGYYSVTDNFVAILLMKRSYQSARRR